MACARRRPPSRPPTCLEALEPRRLLTAVYPLTSLPILHSRPTATARLYIDFDGDPASAWNGYNVPATPAYSLDSDPATYNDWELDAIREIWARVAEKYSPFNINVTTEKPAALADGVAFRIVVGGTGTWFSTTPTGGTSAFGGFYNSAPNTGYVFEENLLNGDRKYTAEAIAHEAGHGFGLNHQSQYDSSGNLIREYHRGDAATAPLMGTSYYSARGLWWNGPTTSPTTIQDDLAVLAGPLNGFGFRADDHGNTLNTATALTTSGSRFTGAGVIERSNDQDVFSFTTATSGFLTFTVNPAQFGPMLDLKLELRSSAGTIIAAAATTSLGEVISADLPAGSYHLIVMSNGGYGDIGQYTISGDVSTHPPGTFQGTAGNDTLQVRLSASGQEVEFFENAPLTGPPSFTAPLSLVSTISVLASGGNDTLIIHSGNFALGGTGTTDLAVSLLNSARLTLTRTERLASLSLGGSSRLTITAAGNSFLRTRQLALPAGTTLDIGSSALILQASSQDKADLLALLTGRIKSARNGGSWSGAGLTSAHARDNLARTTGVVITPNWTSSNTPIHSSFLDEAVDENTILVRYSWNGDTDANGALNIDDYQRLDVGFLFKLAGYHNGDFNFDGLINLDDYWLVDQAFAQQLL